MKEYAKKRDIGREELKCNRIGKSIKELIDIEYSSPVIRSTTFSSHGIFSDKHTFFRNMFVETIIVLNLKNKKIMKERTGKRIK